MKCILSCMFAVALVLSDAPPLIAQQEVSKSAPAKLPDLLVEGEANNPQIQAARQEWQCMRQMPTQVATLKRRV